MRIERRRVITIELSREEAIALRRALLYIADCSASLDEETVRVSGELKDGLGQNLYETRENYA